MENPETGKELRAELGFSNDDFLLLYAAEFSARKNQSFLIEALANLPQNVHLLLPGNGILLEDCKELASNLGVSDRIVFPGYVSEMKRWYMAADVSVSSSRSEGLPFNVMEAMHFGLPVVASAVKGHVDLIEDGTCGFLYPMDDKSIFVDKIKSLVSEPDKYGSFALKAKDKVEGYHLELLLPEVMSLYESLSK